VDDLAHARALCDQLGDPFCLTYLKGVDAAEALRRLGGHQDTPPDREPRLAFAVELGAWSVVIEPGGTLGADHALLEEASRGSAAVSVLRHGARAAHFGYVVDGTTITAFDPAYPAQETTWGEDPQFLRRLMDALELRAPADEHERGWHDAEARAIVLAQRITGSRLPDRPVTVARLSAELEPWFVTPASGPDLLRAGRRTPQAADLVTAAEAAHPEVQRRVATAEVRRQATVLGLTPAPGLAEALATGRPVVAGSPLGRQIRVWLAGTDPGLPWFLSALRGGLSPDPRVAVLAALKPYTSGLPGLADPEARAAVLSALRDQAG
jgi:hypothetical protein